ncbi:H-type small acid-soluble spore protein [Cohnella terricola]|uniref:H-type small acid-soluble spore protein n=2 Tax=Cohnella terricola TaxID=1289167 RepID=A0A559JR77_9BACL|nr:H-type small acid-soluble spore protein [Cohnella terricola]
MNTQRAAEIANSPVMANVTYQNANVYIQHVDEANETARIYALDRPDQEFSVPLGMLVEQRSDIESQEAIYVCPTSNESGEQTL